MAALVLLVLFVAPGAAEGQLDCNKAKSTLEINACLENDFQNADKALNETYQRFGAVLRNMEKFPPMTEGFLVNGIRNAQRAWIEYRDKNCNFYSNLAYGGSAAGTYYISCKVRMTREREAELAKESSFWQEKGN
jgi:uncharacterized protein YecT (DUF1311 family)